MFDKFSTVKLLMWATGNDIGAFVVAEVLYPQTPSYLPIDNSYFDELQSSDAQRASSSFMSSPPFAALNHI